MEQKPRVALFIDAENASAQHADEIVRYCESKGSLAIRRCYGREASLKAWEKANAAHYIYPFCTPPSASKANASDFSLVINAVALLHNGCFDHAVLVSSDSDFVLLAMHVREHGKTITGVVTQKANVKMRSAFSEVLVLSDAKVSPPKSKPTENTAMAAKPKPTAKKAPAVTPAAKAPAVRPAAASPVDSDWLSKIFESLAGPDGRCHYESYKRALAKDRPGYQRGHGKADVYIQKSGLFNVKDKLLSLRIAK